MQQNNAQSLLLQRGGEKMNIVSVYDGTLHSKIALRYGIEKIKEKGGELIVLYVFETSMLTDYDIGPKAEEIARAESKCHLRDAESIIREAGKGSSIRLVSEEGDPEQAILRAAKAGKADLILVTPRYKPIAKKADCPVYIIPGTILLPIDSAVALNANIDAVSAEARATCSKVLLLGVVPVHLYSAGEQEEVEKIKKGTAAILSKIKKGLRKEEVECSEEIRSGYPDEEILKAAEEHAVSLIMLPAGGKARSELSKAAEILQDEPERVRPIYFMPAFEV